MRKKIEFAIFALDFIIPFYENKDSLKKKKNLKHFLNRKNDIQPIYVHLSLTIKLKVFMYNIYVFTARPLQFVDICPENYSHLSRYQELFVPDMINASWWSNLGQVWCSYRALQTHRELWNTAPAMQTECRVEKCTAVNKKSSIFMLMCLFEFFKMFKQQAQKNQRDTIKPRAQKLFNFNSISKCKLSTCFLKCLSTNSSLLWIIICLFLSVDFSALY